MPPYSNSHFRYQSSTGILDKKLDKVLEPKKSSVRTALIAIRDSAEFFNLNFLELGERNN